MEWGRRRGGRGGFRPRPSRPTKGGDEPCPLSSKQKGVPSIRRQQPKTKATNHRLSLSHLDVDVILPAKANGVTAVRCMSCVTPCSKDTLHIRLHLGGSRLAYTWFGKLTVFVGPLPRPIVQTTWPFYIILCTPRTHQDQLQIPSRTTRHPPESLPIPPNSSQQPHTHPSPSLKHAV